MVNPANDWAQCLTVEQLNTMWAPEAEGTITSWNQIDPSFPDLPLDLYGPATATGPVPHLPRETNRDGGEGCVTPSRETVQDGTYTPLGRPLFIYVNNAKYSDNPAVQAFVDFYLENEETIAEEALVIDLTDEQVTTARTALDSLKG